MNALASLAADAAALGLDSAIEAGVWGMVLLAGAGWATRRSAPLAFALLAVGLLVFAAAPLALPIRGAFALPLPSLAAATRAGSRGWLTLVFAVWAAGSLLQATRLAVAAVALDRSHRAARRRGPVPTQLVSQVNAAASALGLRAPEVLISPTTRAPYVFGARPCLVVPVGWMDPLEPSRLRLTLFHELAHLKRGDLGWIALANAVSVVWWWHPVFWKLAARVRSVQEHVADDMAVLAAAGDEEHLCEMLLDAAAWPVRSNPGHLLSPAGLDSGTLESRIRRLMDPHARRRTGMTPLQCVGVVVLMALALPAVASRLGHAAHAPAPHRHAHFHSHHH